MEGIELSLIIVKQPDRALAIWCSDTKTFVMENADYDGVKKYFVAEAVRTAELDFAKRFERISKGSQYHMYADCVKEMESGKVQRLKEESSSSSSSSSKYVRTLGMDNVSFKMTGNATHGFVSLFDTEVPYIQGINGETLWRLNVTDISISQGRDPKWCVQFGPSILFAPPLIFRGGVMAQVNGGFMYEDETEKLVFTAELCMELLRLKKEQTGRS